MSNVRIAEVALLYYDDEQPQVRLSRVELITGALAPTRFRLTEDGWRPVDTELL